MAIETKLLPPRYLLGLVLGPISVRAFPLCLPLRTGCFKKYRDHVNWYISLWCCWWFYLFRRISAYVIKSSAISIENIIYASCAFSSNFTMTSLFCLEIFLIISPREKFAFRNNKILSEQRLDIHIFETSKHFSI
jgi:hypothetical protein